MITTQYTIQIKFSLWNDSISPWINFVTTIISPHIINILISTWFDSKKIASLHVFFQSFLLFFLQKKFTEMMIVIVQQQKKKKNKIWKKKWSF